ncbi:proline--tRNA ligase [Ferrimicrobium sp.]|uniref:proline--tRNA ligase n=1 Tax=Ferrimicrobium sp. TaxID=2926050 RepID=UPI0026259F2C|nr:proline--tRNA ligase [Ferrimicrobium sp.]
MEDRDDQRPKQVLTSQAVNFAKWYQEIVGLAELAENGPARGSIVIRPYGYAIWELMQSAMDARIKAIGVKNASFPLLIPQSLLSKEAEHVEGFSPELAVVTHAGGHALEEPLVVRPTSEAIVGDCMSRWVQSYRDLPLLLNQWANVVRWEMRPRSFLRTSEFLWQEGHTAHKSAADAQAFAKRVHLEVYRDFLTTELAMPVHVGVKSPRERFAGAVNTLTCEALMMDGKALQIATSHELGQNFSRAFGIEFLDSMNDRQFAWTTSWGSSTRMIGGLIMGHGDDAGLRLPPRLAPVQVVIIPIQENHEEVRRAVADLEQALIRLSVRVEVDRASSRLGRKIVAWELKGVPLRVELGPRDVANGQISVVRRDSGDRISISIIEADDVIIGLLAAQQADMTERAANWLADGTVDVKSVDDAVDVAKSRLARIKWAKLGEKGETKLATEGITVRCLQRPDGSAPDGVDESGLVAIVGRAY